MLGPYWKQILKLEYEHIGNTSSGSAEAEFRAFVDGIKAAIEAYAVWKDGVQYIGVFPVALRDIFIDLEDYYAELTAPPRRR
jgi:hypothetical protein